MKLVIVDTPAQAKHVADTLDESWRVEPCLGDVRDLATDKLGIDMLHDFQPSYTLLPRKGNLVRRMMRAISNADAIYIATPSGRLGEVMGWHILALAPSLKDKSIYRTPLTALTPQAIQPSFAVPQELNLNWVEAEISQRVIDQLIAYLVSPLANEVLDTNMLVSRASLVCLEQLVANDHAVRSFESERIWSLKAHFVADEIEFEAKLYSTQGKALKFKTREQADSLAVLLTNAAIWVDKAASRTTDLDAPRPYSMMTLIADAEVRLDIEPTKTFELTQMLYEAGWITNPTPDFSTVSPQSVADLQAFIAKEYGSEYVPYPPRPSDVSDRASYLYPAEISRLPEQLPGDGAALYGLIWHQFAASLMASARLRQSGARILAGSTQGKPFPLEFRVQMQQVLFDGWQCALPDESASETDADLPHLTDGAFVTLKSVQIEEVATEPLSHMTPGTLMTTLAAKGISRSSDYVAAIDVLIESGNVELIEGRLVPTEQGIALAAFAEKYFSNAFSVGKSAQLERDLENVARGAVKRLDLLREFWSGFGPLVTNTAQSVLNHGLDTRALRINSLVL